MSVYPNSAWWTLLNRQHWSQAKCFLSDEEKISVLVNRSRIRNMNECRKKKAYRQMGHQKIRKRSWCVLTPSRSQKQAWLCAYTEFSRMKQKVQIYNKAVSWEWSHLVIMILKWGTHPYVDEINLTRYQQPVFCPFHSGSRSREVFS